jgi:DNA repair exonuclease SbcCD ATPase subunit/DNA repair exonuclease SbcCD nuclease subunit
LTTFATISDTHIRNLKFHDEMKIVFQEIYNALRMEPPDYIIHLGDLCHSKTHLSPEYVDLAGSFLKNLSEIAETYIIPGNHDFTVKNLSRQDAITPIVTALNLPSLHYLKFSEEVPLRGNIVLNARTLFDSKNWKPPSDPSKINILLFHGALKGCHSDDGHPTDWAEYDRTILDGFDYAFLGDIHAAQTIDERGKMRYIGSTMQECFSDLDNKGFFLWEINGKDDFTCEQVVINSPKPFITLRFDEKCRIDKDYIIKPGSKIRIISDFDIPSDVVRKALNQIRSEYKPEALFFVDNSKFNKLEERPSQLEENLRDLDSQEKMIERFLDGSKINKELLKRIFELNKKYNELVESNDSETARNVCWKIKRAEWSYLFNYGEFNCIEFDKLSGVVGLFGKNYSGKSNAIGSILFTIFNELPKKSCKNVDIINQNQEKAYGKEELEVGDWVYLIHRAVEKYTKRLHGEETIEAKVTLDFTRTNTITGEEENLNGEGRTQTDVNIRRTFGTIEDFLLTGMTSQFGALSYVNEGSTKRKEILAKFLDLDIFGKKFELAKEEASELRAIIKKQEKNDFLEEIEGVMQLLQENAEQLSACNAGLEEQSVSKRTAKTKLEKITSKIPKLSSKTIDIQKSREHLEMLLGQKEEVSRTIAEHKQNVTAKEELRDKITKFETQMFDVEEYQKRKSEIDNGTIRIGRISSEIKVCEGKIKANEKKQELLTEVPCGEQFKGCKFIHDAFESREIIKDTERLLENAQRELENVSKHVESLRPMQTKEYLERYDNVLKKKHKNLVELAEERAALEKQYAVLAGNGRQIEDCEAEIGEYEKNKVTFKKIQKLTLEKDILTKECEELSARCQILEKRTIELSVTSGALGQKVKDLEEKKKEYEINLQEYSAYEYFLQCCHPSGIAFDIIKGKLPVINEEISKILTNMAKFEVFLENNEDRLHIFIKHPKYGKRTISLASGAELLLAALAIRLAFVRVSNLSKCENLIILDEPAANFDESHLASFSEMIGEVLKKKFQTVLLISHLEILKDSADIIIPLENIQGYAKIIWD